MKPEQQRIKELLTETITMLCRNGLHFKNTFSIEGLLGITLDEDEVFLINIKETIQNHIETLVKHPDNVDHLLVNGTAALNKEQLQNQQTCGKADVPVTEAATAIVENFVPHTYSAVQGDGSLGELVIKEEHISESEGEHTASRSVIHKRRKLSLVNTSTSTDQTIIKTKMEMLSGSSVWDAASHIVSNPYMAGSIIPVSPVAQTPKKVARRRKNSNGSSPVPATVQRSIPVMKTPSAAMHYMNIATSILRTDGSFATVRVIRRKNQRFTAEQIIHVMNMMTNPQGSEMYVGEYHQLKKKIHVFYKCPPSNVKPKALQGYGMSWETYNEQYYKSARPHKNGPVDWQNYLGTVRQFAPFDLPVLDQECGDEEEEDEEEDYEGNVELQSPEPVDNEVLEGLQTGLSTALSTGSIDITISDSSTTPSSQLYNSLPTTELPPEVQGVGGIHEEVIQDDNCVIEEAVIHDWNSSAS